MKYVNDQKRFARPFQVKTTREGISVENISRSNDGRKAARAAAEPKGLDFMPFFEGEQRLSTPLSFPLWHNGGMRATKTLRRGLGEIPVSLFKPSQWRPWTCAVRDGGYIVKLVNFEPVRRPDPLPREPTLSSKNWELPSYLTRDNVVLRGNVVA